LEEAEAMTEREKIFARIKEALRQPAPPPDHSHDVPLAHPRQQPGFASGGARQWLAAVGASSKDQLALFQKNALDLKAEVLLMTSREELAGSLRALRETEQWKKVGVHAGELTDFAAGALGLAECRTDQPYNVQDLESCGVGVSECDALIAQTGSVLVTGRSAGGRALSVLPPHHIVLARMSQLIADLPEAFALLKTKYAPNYPSFISFITGPSRTGDIERILVLGAHGPKKLTILILAAE
jgi:L-lactate dehydrogenase complex protein LldG